MPRLTRRSSSSQSVVHASTQNSVPFAKSKRIRTRSQAPLPAISSLSWALFYELLETPKFGHHAHDVALEPVIEALGRAARPVRRRGLALPSGRERAGDQQRLASRDDTPRLS